MNWFLAKVVYQIICGDGLHTPQFDEQLRLISAIDEEEALQKGRQVGVQEEDVFYNNRQQLVQWKFVGVSELTAVTQFADGAEVYSQIKEVDDEATYKSFVLHKAARLNNQCASPKLQTA